MIKYVFFIFIFLIFVNAVLPNTVKAKGVEYEPWVLDASNIKWVYDGDTITHECIPHYNCPDGKLKIRIINIDTAEIQGKCDSEIALAYEARDALINILESAETIVVHPSNRKLYDQWYRLRATITADGRDVGDLMVSLGLARTWSGRRESWCR